MKILIVYVDTCLRYQTIFITYWLTHVYIPGKFSWLSKYFRQRTSFHTSIYDKRDDFGLPIVDFPWLSGDVPRLPSYCFYISQFVRFARCCTSVLGLNSKTSSNHFILLPVTHGVTDITSFEKHLESSYSGLLSKFGDVSFQKYISEGISHPVFYGDLVYKLRRVKGAPNFVLRGSKIVKRLRRQKYDPVIIERAIRLVLDPSKALYRSFLKNCTLTRRWWLYDGTRPNLLRGEKARSSSLLIINRDSTSPWTWARFDLHSIAYSAGCL